MLKQTFSEGSIRLYKKSMGNLSELKSPISPVDLTLKWTRPFQTEFVESNHYITM